MSGTESEPTRREKLEELLSATMATRQQIDEVLGAEWRHEWTGDWIVTRGDGWIRIDDDGFITIGCSASEMADLMPQINLAAEIAEILSLQNK